MTLYVIPSPNFEKGNGPVPDLKTDEPKSLRNIPSNWPIELKNGKIFIPHESEGRKITAYIDPRILQPYLDSLNHRAKQIAETTQITSHPELSMGEPVRHAFRERLRWHSLRQQLEASGANITVLKPENGNEDFIIWPRDRWVAGDNKNIYPQGILERFATQKERFGQLQAAQDLARRNADQQAVREEILSGFIEGGDVLQHPQTNSVFIGVYADSEGNMDAQHLSNAQALAESLKMRLIPIPKTNGSTHYHLDTFMFVLPNGSIGLLPEATTLDATSRVRDVMYNWEPHRDLGEKMLEIWNSPGEELSELSQRTYLSMNLVTVNGNVFTANAEPELAAFLQRQSEYKLREGNFQISDSSAHCLTSPTNGRQKKNDGRTDISDAQNVNPLANAILTAQWTAPATLVKDSMDVATNTRPLDTKTAAVNKDISII